MIINTGVLEEQNMKAMTDIARENSVSELPSVLLLDRNGKPRDVIPGKFAEDELDKLIDGLVKN